MFSGIITATGKVARTQARSGGVTLTLDVPQGFRELDPGASVAVNGTCLTVTGAAGSTLSFDAVGATLDRTLIGRLRAGDRVNLEKSLTLGSPVDGHLVTGHVDGVATVEQRREGDGAVYFALRVPGELGPQIALRGSVAVDGVSLTVSEVRGLVFGVSVVPYTLRETILGDYRPGRRVHLETDVLAKYVERAMAHRAESVPSDT